MSRVRVRREGPYVGSQASPTSFPALVGKWQEQYVNSEKILNWGSLDGAAVHSCWERAGTGPPVPQQLPHDFMA